MTETVSAELNLTTEKGMRALVAQGQSVEVLCHSEPIRKGPSWYGLWTMRARASDGQEKRLITARTRLTENAIRIREFKTATGVISFLTDLGFAEIRIPMKPGSTTTHASDNTHNVRPA